MDAKELKKGEWKSRRRLREIHAALIRPPAWPNQSECLKAGLPRRSRFGEGGSKSVKVSQTSLFGQGSRPIYLHVIQNEQLTTKPG
jgi:hypothetical protein